MLARTRAFASLAAAVLLAASPKVLPAERPSPGARPPLPALSTFDGLTGRNPSDNSLAVGRDHVMQTVNSQLAIYTKKGEIVYGPLPTNTIFAGFGGVCEARPNGDAVVRYDQLADRWLVVMPIFRRTVFGDDRSTSGAPARPGDAARAGIGKPGPPPPLPPAPQRGQQPPQTANGTYAMCYAVSATADPLGTYYRYVF